MGRPKKPQFSCKYCDKMFKRQFHLQKHMLCHSGSVGQSRRARMRSHWCHVCRQSFSKAEYKLHILSEHKYDSSEIDTDDSDSENANVHTISSENNEDFYSSDNESVDNNLKRVTEKMTSTRSRKKASKILQADPTCSMVKIKAEPFDVPSDMYKSNVSPQKRRKLSVNSSSFVICNKCGMKFKGQRGLKIHLSTTHKRNPENNFKQQNSPKVVKQGSNVQFKQEQLDETSEQCNNLTKSSIPNQPSFAYNIPTNLSQNAQTGLIYNMLPIQNQPLNNFISIGNQPNIQILPVVTNQSEPVEKIPKFDSESEDYIKWLKNFINRCIEHKYPLTPTLCQSVSHINEEITEALANPVGTMTKRVNHFYFRRIKSVLSEIMLGQMRYSLNVVVR